MVITTLARHIELEAFHSDRIVVAIKAGTTRRKICQMIFRPDYSIFVNFPYFGHRVGLLATLVMPAGSVRQTQIHLDLAGKIASHSAKYSHHADGRAHFSQDGKIRTEVRQALPLEKHEGHLFSIMLHGRKSSACMRSKRARWTIRVFSVLDA